MSPFHRKRNWNCGALYLRPMGRWGPSQACLQCHFSGSVGKESAYNAGDLDSIPGSGRSLEEEMLAHSSILAWKIPMDRGTWRAAVHGVPKSWTQWVTEHSHDPEVWFTRTYGSSFYNFVGNLHTVFHNGCTLCIPTNYVKGSLSSMSLLTLIFFCNSYPDKCDVIFHCVLILISLIISNSEHFFIYYWPFICLFWRSVYLNP